MPKKKFRNTETGQIEEYEIDRDGRPVFQTKPSESQFFRTTPGIESEIRAPTWSDYVFNYGGRFVKPALAATGSILGGLAGGATSGGTGTAIGSALGSGAGTLAGQSLQQLSPEIFGQYKPEEALGEVGTGVAADLFTGGVSKVLGSGFPSARANIIQNLIKRFLPAQIDDATKAAIAADPEFKYTVGQVNPTARTVENVLAPKAKSGIIQEQQKTLANKASQLARNPETTIKDAQAFAFERASKMKAKSKALYGRFDPAITYNTKNVVKEIPGKPVILHTPQGPIQIKGQSTFEPVKIEGAIPLNKSKQFADNLGDEIDKILGPNDVNAVTIGNTSGTHLRNLRNELNKIRGVQQFLDPITKKPTSTFGEFRQLKEIRDSLNRFTQSSEFTPLRDKLQGSLQYLEAALRKDIDEGVRSWGPNAYGRFRKAQDYWQEVAKRLDSKMANDLLAAGKDPEQTYLTVAKEALKDPQKTRQFIGIAGRDKATRLFNDNLHNAAIDGTGKLNPQAALDFLKTNDLVAKEALPSKTLSEYRRFFQRASIVGPHMEGSRLPMLMKLTSAGLSLGVGAGSWVAGASLPKSALFGSLILGGAQQAHKATEKWLLNPRTARIATGLLDADPTSAKAKLGQKAILATMKGMQVMFRAEDGREFPVEITDGGRLKPVSPPADSNNQ